MHARPLEWITDCKPKIRSYSGSSIIIIIAYLITFNSEVGICTLRIGNVEVTITFDRDVLSIVHIRIDGVIWASAYVPYDIKVDGLPIWVVSSDLEQKGGSRRLSIFCWEVPTRTMTLARLRTWQGSNRRKHALSHLCVVSYEYNLYAVAAYWLASPYMRLIYFPKEEAITENFRSCSLEAFRLWKASECSVSESR